MVASDLVFVALFWSCMADVARSGAVMPRVARESAILGVSEEARAWDFVLCGFVT